MIISFLIKETETHVENWHALMWNQGMTIQITNNKNMNNHQIWIWKCFSDYSNNFRPNPGIQEVTEELWIL